MNKCQCPYCGKKISYFSAMILRRRGEYYCKKCKKESNVHISRTIWLMFFGVLVIALIIMGYYLVVTNKENPWFIVFAIIPYILFFFLSPLFVSLRPKKKFQDSLYDTDMMNTPIIEPDPTMASSAKVAPAFIDDIDMMGDIEYKPTINSEVFNAIKEERKIAADTDGGTKAFSKFDNISSTDDDEVGGTRMVGNLKDISKEIDL